MGAVGSHRWGRVVVIGNSIAGLLAARALADHAERVTLIDRDRIPDEAKPRAGVPHGRHIHVVLTAGQRSMEALLPGVLEELASLDVPAVGMPRDIIQRNRGQWVRRWAESLTFLTGTRALVEHVVRRRVLAHENIDSVDSLEVVGLDGDRGRVRGVRLRPRGAAPAEQTMTADLVVDASGRGSRTVHWLASIGTRPPAEERIETGLAYATRRYRATIDPAVAEYLGIYLLPRPGAGSGAVVMPVEEPGTYLVTLTGLPGDEPPTEPDAFEEFTARLEHPIVHEWLATAEADGPPLGYRSTANIRRRYDRLNGPEGLLVVGDAATSFNPVYGQGISVAALGALALRRALATGRPTIRRLQRLVIDAGDQAWRISTGVDKNLPTATGNAVRSGPTDRAATWYLGRVQDHAASDMVVGNAFRDVVHLVAPVSSLLSARVARTVLFGRPRPGPAQPPLHPERTPADSARASGARSN
jgi:2-polyprenyl-6-methoxyphenol hydroxylase-like FAD-dependent oxidoreductase